MQSVYFNYMSKNFVKGKFSYDYWGVGNLLSLNGLLNSVSSKEKIKVASASFTDINKSKFRSNIGQGRGAINVWGSDTTSFIDCEFYDNVSGNYGGGFIVHHTNFLSIDSCNISNNTAINGTGGGLSLWDIGEGIISNSLILELENLVKGLSI